MRNRLVKDFYEVQRLQARKSLLLLLVLIVFYFIAVMIISSVFILFFGLMLAGEGFLSGRLFLKVTLIISVISLVAGILHFYDARKFGAKFIRKRLQARPPDLDDRYYKQFANTVDEIRIASGLPRVKPYIIPSFAINSMALIDAEKPQKIICPDCGSRMLPRPYSYHYVVPVDKCLSCNKIWFDADELEILQILIERR